MVRSLEDGFEIERASKHIQSLDGLLMFVVSGDERLRAEPSGPPDIIRGLAGAMVGGVSQFGPR
jgi:hypothetical protein